MNDFDFCAEDLVASGMDRRPRRITIVARSADWKPRRPKLRCYCPDDCNCRTPWRTNYCGCKQHETGAAK